MLNTPPKLPKLSSGCKFRKYFWKPLYPPYSQYLSSNKENGGYRRRTILVPFGISLLKIREWE